MKSGIISARHGSYDSKCNLNDAGKGQMHKLATAIKDIANGHNLDIYLLCSAAPRAQQGAPIIAEILQIPNNRVTFHESLWHDNTHRCDCKEVKRLVESAVDNGSLSIFLSHLDTAPAVTIYALKKFGRSQRPGGDLYYGQGVFITQNDMRILP